jgi:outer membrane usher protein
MTASGDASADEILILEVEVNGRDIGKVGEFTVRHGKLLARPSELRELGFRVPDSKTDGLLSLSDLPGVTWNLDRAKLLVHITTSESQLAPTLVHPDERQEAAFHRVIESGTGVTLNYDIVDTVAAAGNSANAALDVRAFSPQGTVTSNWVAFAGMSSGPSGRNKVVRLDSAYTFADVNSLRRYSLGDFTTNGLSWTRPVHMMGAQIRSDFSTRPDLITFPLPSLAGSTAVPSTVQVLADGNVVASSEVAPGPFEVPQIPVISGAGMISMTMTNALGQQVTINQPFYASYALLAKGLQTFAAQAGPVRRNWGSESYDYGEFAASGGYRRSFNSKLTIEGVVEGTPETFMTGAGGVRQIANLGVINFSAAGSFGSTVPGYQFSAGGQRVGRRFSAGAAATLADRNFRDIASMNGDAVLRRQLSGYSSFSLRRFGTGGVAYAGIDEDPSPKPVSAQPSSAIHSHIVSGSYSFLLHRMAIYASAFRSLDSGVSGTLQVGLTIPLGRRSSATMGWTSNGDAQPQVQQSAAQIQQWGYQGYVSGPHSQHEFGIAQYKSHFGLMSARLDSNSGETTGRLEAQGALSLVDRSLFASNTIHDSFAIVDTSPLSNIRVLQENRDVGRTGPSGRLLVPDMRSFELNHIIIEATELPADLSIRDPSREMRPRDRSGVVVKFPIKFSRGALLRLIDESGRPLPLGSAARLKATGVTVPVGYDGQAYVEDLSSHNELTVERPDGRRCTALFDYQPTPGDIPSIGPLRCTEQKP